MNKHELAMDDFELNVDFRDIDLDLFKKGYFEDGLPGEPGESGESKEPKNKKVTTCPECGCEF